MSDQELLTPTRDQEESTGDLTHAGGWERTRTLCGQTGTPKPRVGPVRAIRPSCVVCWDIWTRMNEVERQALWAVRWSHQAS